MLFFFAGYEIDFERIRGEPLRLGAWGWVLSLVLAYGIGGALAAAGVVISYLYTGSALATTAIGTLIPILRDTGELRTRFGTYLLAAGAAGEFGPILLITLVLSTAQPLHEAAILGAFIALALLLALLAVRLAWRGFPALERTSSRAASSRFGSRPCSLRPRCARRRARARHPAGRVRRRDDRPRGAPGPRADGVRVEADGGRVRLPDPVLRGERINFDLTALGTAEAIGKLVLFLALFLVVRGTPALLLYRKALDARGRLALAFFSATELPLVVAITTPRPMPARCARPTAAGLVGAAMLSTLIYLFVGMALRRGVSRRSRRPTSLALDLGAPPLRRQPALPRGRGRPRRPPPLRGRRAPAIRSRSRSTASARLRAWLPCVLGHRGHLGPKRPQAPLCSSSSTEERSMSNTASIREAVTFACWPPGPDERLARSSISSIRDLRDQYRYSSGLYGPSTGTPDVGRLLGGQVGEADAERVEVQPRDLLVEVLGEHVDALLVVLVLREELDLGDRLLVNEFDITNDGWPSRCRG